MLDMPRLAMNALDQDEIPHLPRDRIDKKGPLRRAAIAERHMRAQRGFATEHPFDTESGDHRSLESLHLGQGFTGKQRGLSAVGPNQIEGKSERCGRNGSEPTAQVAQRLSRQVGGIADRQDGDVQQARRSHPIRPGMGVEQVCNGGRQLDHHVEWATRAGHRRMLARTIEQLKNIIRN